MSLKRIPRIKAGDPITAELLNTLAERFQKFRNLRSGSPYVRILDSPTGKSIALAFPERTYALLSGSTSPYSFTEVRDAPGGTWVSMPNGDSGTSNVYEVNGKAGLGGKVVPIEWTSARDWRFQWVGQSPPNCVGKGNTLRFELDGCPHPFAARCPVVGATVAFVLGGVTVYSGTTNSLGQVDYFEPLPGTYTINWSVPGTAFSGSTSSAIAATCTPSLVLASVNINAPAGYQCCGVGSIQNARALPFPPFTSMFITDDAGTRAFGDCFIYNGYVMRTGIGCSTSCSNEFSIGTSYIPVPAPPTDPCTYLDSAPNCPAGAGPTSSSGAGISLPATSESPFEIAGTWPSGVCGYYIDSFPLAGSPFLVHT